MLTQEETVELNALVRRGWKIAAIARHMGRDRKTVRPDFCRLATNFLRTTGRRATVFVGICQHAMISTACR